MTLLERLENAAEGSRELDCRIHVVQMGGIWIEARGLLPDFESDPDGLVIYYLKDGERRSWIPEGKDVPRYTTNLQDALKLVPDGFEVTLRFNGMVYPKAGLTKGGRLYPDMALNTEAATPVLALCAAALRARGDLARRIASLKARAHDG